MPYTVFPLHPITDGVCGCSEGEACPRPGKHPAIRWGELAPGEQIFGTAGHAIATGVRSGIFVVDTDTSAADALFRAQCTPEELDVYTVRTPKGARHYYFVWPGFPVQGSQGKLLWDGTCDDKGKPIGSNIDVRGDGNLIVMAGSPHVNGGVYAVEKNLPPGPAPAWLLAWDGLVGRSLNLEANAPNAVDVATDEGKRRVALGRVACETFTPGVTGENGSAGLFDLSLRLIRDLELPIDTAHELVATVYNPRCEPPWSPQEIDHKLKDARDKSDRPCGIPSEGWDDKLVAACATAAPTAAPEVTRTVHDPAHRYECAIGDVPNGSPNKTSQGEVLSELFGNPSWKGVLQYDAFQERIVAVDPPIQLPGAEAGAFGDEDLTAIRHWFECLGHKSVTKDAAWDCASAVARANAYHPVREYLAGLEACDGALEELALHGLGLTDRLDLLYIRRFLIAAVRRVLAPGCKVDNMLVLKGLPGLKKSTFVIELFGQEWTSENLTNIEDAKAVGEVMAGKWAVEIPEMKEIMKAGNETVAAFITRRSERFRAAYARGNARDRLRSCVLVGSTNEKDLLRNASGADARRLWIVEPVGRIDVDWIRANRDRVWGEAVALAESGEIHWLEGEDEIEHLARGKERYEERDPWHDQIAGYCAGRTTVRVEDVWKALGGTDDKRDQRVTRRITDTLRRLGCSNGLSGQTRVRVWIVPEDLTGGEVSKEEAARRGSEDAIKVLLKPN